MMAIVTVKDGTELYYKDWGAGQPVVFSHGWPLTADAWEAQMTFLAEHGYRCIAHDRRGHGRSSQPWHGNEMDTYADDLAALIEQLDLHDAVLIGHSTGGGEVARYIGRHGTARVAGAVLVGAVPPLMVQTQANPGGLPLAVFDGFRAAYLADRAQFFLDVASGPFFGFNRPGATVSQGLIQSWWRQGMLSGHKNALDCIKAFSETDFTADLKQFDVPTLIIHGDDDQIVPIGAAALLSHDHHEDNLDQAGRALLPRAKRVLTTVPGARRLGTNAEGLRPWQSTWLETRATRVKVTATPAHHGVLITRPVAGATIGFVLEWEGQQHGALYISGDTIYYHGIDAVAKRFRVGIAILHVGKARFPVTGPLRYTMDHRDALRAAQVLRPQTIIPIHYEGWGHFSEDRKPVEDAFRSAGLPEVLHWLPNPRRSTALGRGISHEVPRFCLFGRCNGR